MRRKTALIATILFTITSYSIASAQPDTSVYVTKHGRKYHRVGCREIKRSVGILKMSISDAKAKGLTPCKVCKPGDGK